MILDTSALLAVLYGEPEAERFLRLIHGADRCRLSAGSYLELAVVLERQAAPGMDRQCEALLRRAGIQIVAFTVEQAYIARQAFHDFGKGRHPAALNYGDCFAYALAKSCGEPLLFKGGDFSRTDVAVAAS